MSKNLSGLAKAVDVANKNESELEQTKEFRKLTKSEEEKIDLLKKIQKSDDIKEILDAEKIFLTAELIKSDRQKASIDAALKQWDEGKKSLHIVDDKETYGKAVQTFASADKDKLGLPKDAFRKFIASHQTRLDNNLANPSSEMEAETLKQRKANLNTAEKIYKAKQVAALAGGKA